MLTYLLVSQRSRAARATIIGCLVVAAFVGCRPSESSPQIAGGVGDGGVVETDPAPGTGPRLFSDITEKSGVTFSHQAGGDTYFVPRSIGSGVALVDCDNDGRLDVYLIQNAGPDSGVTNRLYRQADDGTFHDVSAGSGLDVDGFGMGVAAGDVNNDGRVDLLITEYGRIRLFLNDTSATKLSFVDVTSESKLNNPGWGTSASFFDYDRDGWLDLVVANYLDYDPSRQCTDAGGRVDFCGPQSFAPVVARLFRNRGVPNRPDTEGASSTPQFDDVTIAAGFASKPGAGLGVLCVDINDDRWIDVFLANDGTPNTLWINQSDGTFVEEAVQRGLAYNAMGEAEADMGIALGDVNGDGSYDIFVTHRASETHTLWSQQSGGMFIDQTATTGITRTAWRGTGFGTNFSDFDNDGDLDLAIVNGRVLRATGSLPPTPSDLPTFWHPYAQRDQLLLNDGSGRFTDSSEANPNFSEVARVSRGLACGDIDNDGRIDLVVTSIAAPAQVFRNVSEETGHWLLVKAVDEALNRDAYGSQIHLRVGDRVMRRDINPAFSFLSSNDARAHFGLGAADRYDKLRVIWPDGAEEEFGGGNADRIVRLKRGSGVMMTASSEQ